MITGRIYTNPLGQRVMELLDDTVIVENELGVKQCFCILYVWNGERFQPSWQCRHTLEDA